MRYSGNEVPGPQHAKAANDLNSHGSHKHNTRLSVSLLFRSPVVSVGTIVLPSVRQVGKEKVNLVYAYCSDFDKGFFLPPQVHRALRSKSWPRHDSNSASVRPRSNQRETETGGPAVNIPS
jgi:hypothetical protein